ncbi:MAG: hypothetical protein KC620_19440 [Myxococcales bacterium]|nr:hypothetical protein [Myxococcales bacterium]
MRPARFVSFLFALLVLTSAGQAFAVGQFGIRVGTGTSFYDTDADIEKEPDVFPFCIGAAYLLDLALVEVEVDALFWRNAADYSGFEITEDRLAVPVIGKVGLPLVPGLLSASLGAGIEPRFHLATDPEPANTDDIETTVFYVPIVLGANLDLQVTTVGVELRYEHQLTDSVKDDDTRVHHLMFMAGVFF